MESCKSFAALVLVLRSMSAPATSMWGKRFAHAACSPTFAITGLLGMEAAP